MRLMQFQIDDIIKTALLEDINYIDVTTDYLVDENSVSTAKYVSKDEGVLCGIDVAMRVFQLLDSNVKCEIFIHDGEKVKKGDIIARITGSTRALLKGERTALNIVQHMSGVATATNRCVELVKGTKASVADTRKTLPGLRVLQKYAVTVGGGKNHRYNLSDCAMLKDTHLDAYGSMTQEQLAHTLFPVGEMHKDKIRDIAEENKLINADKPDSQDICFIPDGDYAGFITKRCGEQQSGDIVLSDGTKLGKHKGLIHYTIGQRKGVGISYSEPLFVVTKDMEHNRLIMGKADEVYSDSLVAGDVNFIPFDTLTEPITCTAQTRYHQKDAECTVSPMNDGKVLVTFKEPHKAISKGQAVVFYDGEYVIGGGTIL